MAVIKDGSTPALLKVTDAGAARVTLYTAAGAELVSLPVQVTGITDGAGPLTVDGTVGFGPAALAALETTELGSATLAALETIELGVTTLAALEQITATLTGTVSTVNVEDRAATLAVTATGAAAAAVTLTLPAAGPGLFHYITALEVTLYNAAARTGGAAPVVVTSTNLPGALAWTFPTAGAIGTTWEVRPPMSSPLRANAANTSTTIVCPATTGALWRVTAHYFIA